MKKEQKKVIKKFKCNNCSYESKSEQGLRVHIARKHTINKVENQKSCEICDETFQTEKELRKHVKGHYYYMAKFNCVDCDFVGTNEYTMEVHNGKYHTDVFSVVYVNT